MSDEGGDAPCWAHLFENDVLTDETLAGLIRSLADAVIVADPTGTIVFWNASAERLFGWTQRRPSGRSST